MWVCVHLYGVTKLSASTLPSHHTMCVCFIAQMRARPSLTVCVRVRLPVYTLYSFKKIILICNIGIEECVSCLYMVNVYKAFS